MLFNSIEFLYFFAIVYGLYLVLNHRGQNWMLLIASYVFYGWWDWRFLFLIVLSTMLDYICSLKIEKAADPRTRLRFLRISILGNLGVLFFFKYNDFFAGSLQSMLSFFGVQLDFVYLKVILPLGISFYTFQTMSYTIDIYYKRLKPTTHFFDFALFVSFFPQLVAGPIERASHLLPQILKPRKLTLPNFFDGCHLIFWGLFMKMFVADNMAGIVDPIFTAKDVYLGSDVLLATYAFAFQIFCDFAGYSSIARGLGLCMGFDIMENFNLPYFSLNPREFWQRWHISLSTWLRDYLYIPLGGNRHGPTKTYRNLFLTMLLGGLWHGAAWNFVLWGMYHGLLLMVHRALEPLLGRVRVAGPTVLQKLWWMLKVMFFFHVVCMGWIFFRTQGSIQQIFSMLHSLFFNFQWAANPNIKPVFSQFLFHVALLLIVQVCQYRKDDLMVMRAWPKYAKIAFYVTCTLLLMLYGSPGGEEFIYFVF